MTPALPAADVAIVGCGIVGLAAAERLTAHGLSVVAVDGAGIAGGATGASGGLVRALDLSGRLGGWAAESLDLYLRRGRRGSWPAVREHGSLTLVDAAGLPGATAAAAAVRAGGQSADVLTAEEIGARFPGLSLPEGFAGVYEARAGWLPAREVATAMRRDAGPGLRLLTARATGVLTSGSRVAGIATTSGPVPARAVLLAAGVGSTALAGSVGVQLPLITRAVGYCLFELAEPDGVSGPAGPAGPRGPAGLPTVIDSTTGAWLRRWGPGATVLAGVVSPATGIPATVRARVAATEEHRVREVVRHRYPRLAHASLVGGVSAYDAMTVGGAGSVTAWPAPRGLVTATGWNGGGFKLAPAVGARAAARIQEVLA
ncbi:NAD(P)/FAD-dependent oxidoreductase [Kitasatospora sp. NPDC057223]|uniref:NAD(P)/FAD-dependent oxidoreductase n=1 Tax=Kitasatospora sp. NPDC057223 TaxID=3346055 RepID=UPI0036343F49